jgi:hypothetical protein
MQMKRLIQRSIAAALVVSITALGMPLTAQADDRAEVRNALVAYGVAPADAEQRVSALTDLEAAELAARIEELPVGGNAMAALPLAMGIMVVVALLPFIIIGGIVLYAIKNGSNGEVAAGEELGAQPQGGQP